MAHKRSLFQVARISHSLTVMLAQAEVLFIMLFPESEVFGLLDRQFDQIEAIWEKDPYNEVAVYAFTIKEFMQDHRIRSPEEGIQSFKAFKIAQREELSTLGLDPHASELISSAPSASRLTPQTV